MARTTTKQRKKKTTRLDVVLSEKQAYAFRQAECRVLEATPPEYGRLSRAGVVAVLSAIVDNVTTDELSDMIRDEVEGEK